MALRFVHAADLHIDSPLLGLERYEGAPVAAAREATRSAFRNVIDLCLAERARFLVLAGDVFDGDWRDANTGLFFVRELARLREIDARVLLLRGNHDHELTRTLLYRLPDFVHVFGPPERSDARSFVFPADGIAFHGVSYPQRRVTESLLPHYPPPVADLANVGVLHTSLAGAAFASAHERYAPCSPADLTAMGYAYWALGHVHAHQIVARDPWLVYPGNTQGRHVREPGPRGCVVATVEGTRVVDVSFRETSVMRFAEARVQLGENDGEDDLLARVERTVRELVAQTATAGRKPLVGARLTLEGATHLHAAVARAPARLAQNIRAAVLGLGEDVWIEKVQFATRPVTPLEELRSSPGLVGDLLRAAARLRESEGEPDLMLLADAAVGALAKRLRAEADLLGLSLVDAPTLAGLLEQAELLLAERLTEQADG